MSYISAKKASAIFGLKESPQFEIEEKEEKKIYKIAGDEFEYEIHLTESDIKIVAVDVETKRKNELFVSPLDYKNIKGEKVIVTSPYITFNTESLDFVITIRKKIFVTEEKYYNKFYNFDIK